MSTLSPTRRSCRGAPVSWVRPRGCGALALALAVLSGPPAVAADGFGSVTPAVSPRVQVVAPAAGRRVVVAWIERGESVHRVRVADYPDGADGRVIVRTVYGTPHVLWSLKLEAAADGSFYLALSESLGNDVVTRVLRLDGELAELDRVHWFTTTTFLPAGRMLDASGHLFLGIDGLTARGRFIDVPALRLGPTFVVQYQLNDDKSNEPYYGDDDTGIPLVWVTGLDTAIAPDGTGTAVYEFGRIRLRRYAPNRRLLQTLLLDRAPWTPLIRTGETAVAVNGRETLLAWEWHAYRFVNDRFLASPSIPAVKAVLSDGRLTPTLRLEPSSQVPELDDRPAVGLRPDGSGAVAWTERTLEGSRVWLQRLGEGLAPLEAARVVDSRPGFDSDRPMLRSDAEGDLLLSWCATHRGEGPDQIGLLDVAGAGLPGPPPRVAWDGETVRIDWDSPAASRVTLWFSPDLDAGSAVALCLEESLPGPRSFEHTPESPKGFYWLSAE